MYKICLDMLFQSHFLFRYYAVAFSWVSQYESHDNKFGGFSKLFIADLWAETEQTDEQDDRQASRKSLTAFHRERRIIYFLVTDDKLS